MTAIQIGYSNTLAVDMADEDIELASEVAERAGDDDIDIDIDLATAQNYEDYILEDVQSDGGHGEAVVSNDDLMIDEENASYQMDDVDAVEEEHLDNLQMEDADASDMHASEFVSTTYNTNEEGDHALYGTDLSRNSATAAGRRIDSELPSRSGEGEQVLENGELSNDTTFGTKTGEQVNVIPSPTRSPGRHDAIQEGTSDQPVPILALEVDSLVNVGREGEDDAGTVETVDETTLATNHHIDANPRLEQNEHANQPRVIVVYRDAEYSLFSKSETDDPDSFFLSNVELTKEPLSNFFTALREVVIDDLVSDDELYLAIDDLGLEISETSLSVPGITFANIFELYEKLLRNDGVETPGPLCVTLGTKHEFAKRFANLITGAAEGKGLSELISWEETSEELGEEHESLVLGQDNYEFPGNDSHFRGPNEATGAFGEEFTQEAKVEEYVSEKLSLKKITGKETEHVKSVDPRYQANEGQHTGNGGGPHAHITTSEEDNLTTYGQSPNGEGAGFADRANDEVDEDGDLIDYSDEEVDHHDEEEVTNEEFRRHSTSQAAELDELHSSIKQQHGELADTTQSGNGTLEHTGGSSRKSLAEEVDREQNAKNDDGRAAAYGPTTEEEEALQDDEVQAAFEEVTYEDEKEDGDDNNFTPLGELLEEEFGYHFDEAYKEIDFELVAQDPEISQSTNHATASEISGRLDLDTDEIGYEENEALDSNESERTLIADDLIIDSKADGREEIGEDEISYEDENQREYPNSSEEKLAGETSPLSNANTSKRPRVDAEDAIEGSSPQSKRARS